MENTENFAVADCSECPELVSCRSRIVNGVGPMDAEVVLVGEAPGKNEDQNGEPFVGRSGDVLDEALESAGIERENVRITNCVRCRPPDNRDPHVEELSNCSSYLEEELLRINPTVIVPLGRIPAREVVADEFETVTNAAGAEFSTEFGSDETTAIVSVHPAATLYNRELRPTFTETFELVASVIDTNE